MTEKMFFKGESIEELQKILDDTNEAIAHAEALLRTAPQNIQMETFHQEMRALLTQLYPQKAKLEKDITDFKMSQKTAG